GGVLCAVGCLHHAFRAKLRPKIDLARPSAAQPQGPGMTDRPSPPRSDAPLKPAEPARKPANRAVRAGLPLIWLVPIAALIVTLGVGWNMIAGRGTLVSVAFKDATGITPGET